MNSIDMFYLFIFVLINLDLLSLINAVPTCAVVERCQNLVLSANVAPNSNVN